MIYGYIQTATYQFNPYFFHDLSLSLLLRCDPVKWTREREKGRIKIGFEFNTVTTLLNFTKYWKYKNLGEIQLLIWKHTNMFANNVGCEFHSAFTIWQCLLHIASTEAELLIRLLLFHLGINQIEISEKLVSRQSRILSADYSLGLPLDQMIRSLLSLPTFPFISYVYIHMPYLKIKLWQFSKKTSSLEWIGFPKSQEKNQSPI